MHGTPIEPRIIEILPGTHSNLTVADEDGDRLNFSHDLVKHLKNPSILYKSKKLGNYDLIAEYDLDNFMELKNGIWKKDFQFKFDVGR